jgi:Fe-S oxidoreductase
MAMPLDEYRAALEHCTFCAKICRHTCPVGNAERREAVIPQAKMAMANLVRTGQVPLSAETASVFYACAGCGLCGEYCDHEVDVTPALYAARSLATEHGVEPASMKHYAERFHARNEALARDLHQRVPERYFVREAQVAYFPSCDVIEHRPGNISDTFKVLESVGIDYVAIHEGHTVCGGYPLWAAGLTSELSYVAREVARSLSRYKKIICDCPGCIWAMRFLYPQLGAPIHAEVIHVVEFLDHFVSRIQPRRLEPAAFYHDPCYLGRWLGVFDAPRRLLGRAVHEIREFAWNRERGYCCGGGGLVPSTQRDVSVEIARRRMQDVHRTDVKLVVTACATCEWNLARAAGEGVEVIDLMTFLARSL